MKPRRYPCRRPGCAQKAVRLGGYCSRSCRWYLNGILTAEQKSAVMRRARRVQAVRIRAVRFRGIVNARIGRQPTITRDVIYACMADAYALALACSRTARHREHTRAA